MQSPIDKLREYAPDLPYDEEEDILDPDEVEDDPAEVEAAWADEIRRRVEEIRDGTAELYDFEDVMAEMKERYG